MKRALLILALTAPLFGQTQTAWKATTGLVSLTSSGMTATIQQPASNPQQVQLYYAIVYCSVACQVTQAANGTGATATAGTINPILPTPLNTPINATFWTASNVGAGTDQGGITPLAAGQVQTFCLSTLCGMPTTVQLAPAGVNSNYSVTVSSITGNAIITFLGGSK